MTRWTLAALAVALIVAVSPPPAHAITAKQQIAKLKRQASSVKKQRDRARDQRDTLQARVTELAGFNASAQTQMTELRGQVTAANGARDAAVVQRDQALAGLPNAIAAVPVADFYRLVFTPAAAAYPCDSLYTSEDYWSFTFTRPSEFC